MRQDSHQALKDRSQGKMLVLMKKLEGHFKIKLIDAPSGLGFLRWFLTQEFHI
jgi:hypothetical protein